MIAVLLAGWLVAGITVLRLRTENPATTPLMRLRGPRLRPAAPFVPYGAFPDRLVKTLLAAEDPRFFRHRGFDLQNTLFALELNLSKGFGTYGGSTISQQLARTLFLSPEKTMVRKLLELVLALQMDLLLGKERIIELYLNYVEWGRDAWGVVQAARDAYGIAVGRLDELSDAQLAALFAVLPDPQRLSVTNFTNDPAIVRRHDRLLRWLSGKRREGAWDTARNESGRIPPPGQ